MILIATGADASVNNIGQVEVPIIWDSDALAYTTHIPTAFASFSYLKKRAINNFFKGLKSNGLWSKVNQVVLPILGQSEGGVNLKSPGTNVSLPSSGANYNSLGLLLTTVWTPGWATSGTDAHIGAYNTSAATPDSNSKIAISLGGNGIWLGRDVSTLGAGVLIGAGASPQRLVMPDRRINIGPMIASNKTASSQIGVVIDGEYQGSAQAFTVAGAAVTVGFSGTTFNSFGARIGLITHGSALSQSELLAFSSLQTALMNALLAA